MATTQPKIELRKITHSRKLSEETPAYTADVYIDGVLFCHVSNHGQGGPDEQHPPKGKTNTEFCPELQRLDQRIAATWPKHTLSLGDRTVTLDESFEGVCHRLLGENELAAVLRRDLSRKILFKKADGEIYQVKKPPPDKVAQLVALIKQKHGIAQTLNEMPFDEALVLYKTTAG